jgi:hypothetical protein
MFHKVQNQGAAEQTRRGILATGIPHDQKLTARCAGFGQDLLFGVTVPQLDLCTGRA